MDDVMDIDELGPVDWAVIEFPGSRFNGEIAPTLVDLVDRDIVRVLDLLVLKKETDVLVWENTWAAPFGTAVRHCGGQLVAGGRIPIQAILAAVADDLGDEDDEDEGD
jgi:hypothetical protein